MSQHASKAGFLKENFRVVFQWLAVNARAQVDLLMSRLLSPSWSEAQPMRHGNSSCRGLALIQWWYYLNLFEEQHVEPAFLTMLFELSNPQAWNMDVWRKQCSPTQWRNRSLQEITTKWPSHALLTFRHGWMTLTTNDGILVKQGHVMGITSNLLFYNLSLFRCHTHIKTISISSTWSRRQFKPLHYLLSDANKNCRQSFLH